MPSESRNLFIEVYHECFLRGGDIINFRKNTKRTLENKLVHTVRDVRLQIGEIPQLPFSSHTPEHHGSFSSSCYRNE